MIESLYIAWRYISFNKAKTATLVASITLIAFLPLALQQFLRESERQFLSRAAATPLVIGAKGSALDLVMNTLYFTEEGPEPISMTAHEEVTDSGLALPVPVYARFNVRGHPIIGTTLDYFDFRGLKVADGRPLAMLGECVLGAIVAAELGLKAGDSLISSPENLFDLAGVYPLKMKVVGVLEQIGTADDRGIFVDLKTAWIIQGLGHGHQDLTRPTEEGMILGRDGKTIVANAKLPQYTEIDESNIGSFHFHGAPSANPISAVIAVPNDDKSGTILKGRYVAAQGNHQILEPTDIIDGLLKNIFKIKKVLDAVIIVVAMATILAIVLVFALSLRLRQREINTIFMLGCRRMTVARLLAGEVFIIVLMSGAIAGVLVALTSRYSHDLVRMLFLQ